MYSQKDEEKAILAYFGDAPGRLLDIGAYDGRTFSNSLALIERGWGGVLIEPAARAFRMLLECHRERLDRIRLINAALVPHDTGPMTLYHSDDALSTIDEEDRALYASIANFIPITIQPMPMTAIWQFGAEFDFITIDADGVNIQLFQAIPDAVLRFARMICIEHQGKSGTVLDRLMPFGYKLVSMNEENVIAAR